MKEDKLKELSEEIPVPEKVKPEQMEQMLLTKHPSGPGAKRTRKLTARIALAAACMLLLVCAGKFLFSSGIWTFDLREEETLLSSGDSEKLVSSEDSAPGNYEKARQTISKYLEANRTHGSDVFFDLRETAKGAALSEGENSTYSGSASAEDYSGTNLQVEGVDEGDIVKTDGKYIYLVSENTFGSNITIFQAQGKSTKKVSELTADSLDVSEIYVCGGKLVLLGNSWKTEEKDGFGQEKTTVSVYDITDVTDPKLTVKKSQSGRYSHSRMNGNYLYTISNMTIYSAKEGDKKESYIPSVGDTLIPEENMCIPYDHVFSNTYVIITSLDVASGTNFSDSLATLGGDGTCYSSEKNIYIAAPTSQDYSKTIISKFSYTDGKLASVGDKTLRGIIRNQFSMDEYEGNLRFVATTNTINFFTKNQSTSNGLYVLDENMELIGKVDHLAKSERIYSARFLGDKAYFVTYRETDPVFLVDLSDPKNPVVKDELKIPGFSEYLHAFSKNLLLGIGVDESLGTEHVKLSMFDISSDTEVREIHKKILEKNTYSIAGDNHKAVLVSPEKNLIGFSVASTMNPDKYGRSGTSYRVYSYDNEKGFQELGILAPKNLDILTARGLYIGDYLYLSDASRIGGICIYDLKTLKKVGKVHG